MTYNAEYDSTADDIICKDDPHGTHAEGNCPFNICQCDRVFVYKLLDNYKECLTKVTFYFIEMLPFQNVTMI